MHPRFELILSIVTFVATFSYFFNPNQALLEASYGLTKRELSIRLKNDQNRLNKEYGFFVGMAKGSVNFFFLIFSVVLNFVVTPLIILEALSNKIGNTFFAVGALVFIFFHLVGLAYSSNQWKKIRDNEIIKQPTRAGWLLEKTIIVVPITYLWYLFLITIKAI